MSSLYSITKPQSAICAAACATRKNGKGFILPLPSVCPDAYAPIICAGADGVRELALARWGMPTPPAVLAGNPVDRGVSNIRNSTSPHWQRWLAVPSRALVPFTAFAYPERTSERTAQQIWFALGEDRPLGFFAGVWTRWRGVRNANESATEHTLFAFLTTDPNAEISAVNPRAMPVVLTSPDDIDAWMTLPWGEVRRLQRPAPNGTLRVVRKGGRRDEDQITTTSAISHSLTPGEFKLHALAMSRTDLPSNALIEARSMATQVARESGEAGQIELAHVINFRVGGNAAAYVLDGWSQPEETHSWALAPRSKLRIPNTGSGLDTFALLQIDAVFFHPPDGMGLRLVARVGEEVLFDGFLRDAAVVGLALPPRNHGDGDTELTIEYPGAIAPNAVGHAESRPLTARFATAWIFRVAAREPAPPGATRHAAILRALEDYKVSLPARRIRWSERAAGFARTATANGRRLALIVGNCLAEMMTAGLSANPTAAARFSFVEIPLHLRSLDDEETRNLISRADVIFVQGIVREAFERVQHLVRPTCIIEYYPDVVARDAWPFLEGEGHERILQSREGTNFVHVDGALERLRRLIPDRRRRIDAYAALDHGLDAAARRSAEAQARFLEDIDRATGTGIGRFIRDNYREKCLFHDSVHPSHALGEQMCKFAMRYLGLSEHEQMFGAMDRFAGDSVPVHPVLAERLGLVWAAPGQRFLYQTLGEVTWWEWVEAYALEYD